MDSGNFMLWLAWALFGSCLAGLLWKRYLPAVLQAPVAPERPERSPAPAAWLICEEGAVLDRRVRWFPLRIGGRTVIGSVPRADHEDAAHLYLTAEDIRREHAVIQFRPASGRYEVRALDGGLVLHNNEPLREGEAGELVDGDTLDLGRISRFRFTYTGPEEP